jgi:hypothetical protein
MALSENSHSVVLRQAKRVNFPAPTDSNSPAFWDGDTLYVFNSAGHPYRSWGKSVFELSWAESVEFDNEVNGGRWIESVLLDENGVLYGWYHHEPLGLCPGTTLTAPKIGAAVSHDKGATWHDLGFVLEARPGTLRCDAKNGYFAGGHGDFCVILDENSLYLYFFFGNYAGEPSEQGVAAARMLWADRGSPAGKVWKWHNGGWNEPGLGGDVTPFFPVFTAWEREDCDAFWGPSVHWNIHLKRYVMLLNRAKGAGWIQEGVYVSYSDSIGDPTSWTAPQKILDGGAWYPQVIGIGEGLRGTDKLAGQCARFFMSGVSEYEIVFEGA